MPRKTVDPTIDLLLAILDDAYDGKSWHGPNLRGVVRGLPVAEALRTPGGAKHSIAEITVHCAYWKYAARRRLRGDKRGSFPLKGSNWFPLPSDMNESAWKNCLSLLDGEHAALREAVAEMNPKHLAIVPKGSKITQRKLIYGVASHDVYHAGQIRLIKAILTRE